jgi:hypothetical protein
MVTFGRRIKLIDADKFDPNDRPDTVRTFPRDLGDERLEYSGIYEDGWLGDAGFVVLGGRAGATKVVVRGLLPQGIGLDSVDATFQVNGETELHRTLKPGNFEVEVPVGAGVQRVDFRFSALGRLPGGEGRPVSVQLMYIGLEK